MKPPKGRLCPHLPRGPPDAHQGRPRRQRRLDRSTATTWPSYLTTPSTNQPRQTPRPATVRAFLMPKAGNT
jgi:hypothetical protein